MRLYKKSIQLLLALLILSLLASFILDKFSTAYPCLKYWSNVLIGIFSSSTITLIGALIGYCVERRKSLEKFYSCAGQIIRAIKQIKPILIYIPIDLILDYFSESFSKPRHKAMYGYIKEDAQNRLYEYLNSAIKKDILQSNNPEISSKYYMDIDQFDYEIQKVKDGIVSAAKSYVDFYKSEIQELCDLYGNLDFLIGNRSLHRRISLDIFCKIMNFHSEIHGLMPLFSSIADGTNTNYNPFLYSVVKLQAVLFRGNITVENDYMNQRIYSVVADQLLESNNMIMLFISGDKVENKIGRPISAIWNRSWKI